MAACECCVLKVSQDWRIAVGNVAPAAGEADLLAAASFLAAVDFPHFPRDFPRDFPRLPSQ